jgi:hypothetical protein
LFPLLRHDQRFTLGTSRGLLTASQREQESGQGAEHVARRGTAVHGGSEFWMSGLAHIADLLWQRRASIALSSCSTIATVALL